MSTVFDSAYVKAESRWDAFWRTLPCRIIRHKFTVSVDVYDPMAWCLYCERCGGIFDKEMRCIGSVNLKALRRKNRKRK